MGAGGGGGATQAKGIPNAVAEAWTLLPFCTQGATQVLSARTSGSLAPTRGLVAGSGMAYSSIRILGFSGSRYETVPPLEPDSSRMPHSVAPIGTGAPAR